MRFMDFDFSMSVWVHLVDTFLQIMQFFAHDFLESMLEVNELLVYMRKTRTASQGFVLV